MSVPLDAIELLKHDHRIVEQLFADYETAKSDTQRRGVVEILIRELSKHAALEELTVYPFAKRLLPEQAADVDDHLAQHMAVKRTLAALDQLAAGAPEEKRLVSELQEEIAEHVTEEEGQFMPALRNAVDQQALAELGAQLRKAKKLAPTRPHPNIPDQPPGEAVLGALAAIYDRFRDRLQGRPIT
jgi:DNA-binding MurR/RpiR family transcriptional regulator